MAAGIGLREARLCSDESFKRLWDGATDYVLFECLDDSGGGQGCAVAAVTSRYQFDADGGFLKLEYIAVTDPYYQHWIETEGGSGKWHHVCRRSLSTCQRKVGKDQVVHIQKLAFVTSDEVDDCVKQWKAKRLDLSPPGAKKRVVKPVGDDRDHADLRTASTKAKASKPGERRRSRGGGHGGSRVSHSHESARSSEEEDDDVGRSNAPKRRRRRPVSPDGGGRRSPRRGHPADARGTVGDEARKKREGERPRMPALDAMLDDEAPEQTAADKRFEELRLRLDQKKKDKEVRGGAGAVLAKRAQEGLEVRKDKKKKKSEQSRLKDALKCLSKGGAKEESSTSEVPSEEDDDELLKGDKDTNLMSRQRKLRKLSAEKPGTLLLRGYNLMHEQLGTLFGDAGGGSAREDALQPAALRYLLTSAVPQADPRRLGEERLRELRTLATALDQLVSGKVAGAGDTLMQRFKSVLMAVRDNTTAASKYLELIPMEAFPTAATLDEVDYARGLAVKSAKREVREEASLEEGGQSWTEVLPESEQEPFEEACEVYGAGGETSGCGKGGGQIRPHANGGSAGGSAQKTKRDTECLEKEDLQLQAEGRGEDRASIQSQRQGQEEVRSPVVAGEKYDDGDNRPPVMAGEMRPESKDPVVAGCSGCVAGEMKPSVNHCQLESQGCLGGEVPQSGPSVAAAGIPPQLNNGDTCKFLKFFLVGYRSVEQLSKLSRDIATCKPSILQLGVSTLQLLLSSPRDGHAICGWIHAQFSESSSSPHRVRGIFPLPLPPVGAALRLMEVATTSAGGVLRVIEPTPHSAKKKGRQQRKKLVSEGTLQLWRCLCVLVLNGLYNDWHYSDNPPRRITDVQKTAMDCINRWIQVFCADPMGTFSNPDFPELVRNRAVDYSGEETAHALPLRLEELEPGLPLQGVAGSLSAVEAAAGEVQAWVKDPTLTLKSPDNWPTKVPRARINATKNEWYRVCGELYKRGIIESIPYEKIFRANNQVVLNGAFAVEKKGKAGAGQRRVTRLIMNFVPANTFQRLMPGDLSTLSTSSDWAQLLLGPGEVLLWSGDDQRGAYYAWQLPSAWRPFMAFEWPVPGHLVGSSQPWEFVSSRVIPMGWVQAVSLFQHLHRRIGMTPYPVGAGHEESAEWRRDRPAPQSSDGKTLGFVQFYLDDFDCPEITSSGGWRDKVGTMSETHRKQREAYQRWGVGISEDKAHLREPKVVRMGAEVDGQTGTVCVPLATKMEVAYFAFWCMGKSKPPAKVLQMVLGRFVRCADLRAGVSNLVTCSDASEAGGGICCSGSLTDEGQAALTFLQSDRYKKDRCGFFRPQGAVPVLAGKGPKVVVVSLFDGIAALMCALCRLDCQVVAFASSEVDKECKRLVRRRWPGVLELGDITKVSEETLGNLMGSVGFSVDFVLCGGGSPCQDLSVLLANRTGLAGSRSKLFFEMPRIFKGLRRCFSCPVYTFVENVFSMTPENRAQFSETLGVEPILVDCTSFSMCRRPRLFWVDWPVQAGQGEQLVQHEGYRQWRFPDWLEDKTWWVDRCCTYRGDGPLPTFTRALPRKSPPKQPAGIQTASQAAIDRWQADRHRFQVYQYEDKYLVERPDGEKRVPSLTERERLMGFPAGYVSAGINPKLTMAEAFDVGASMIGNSFNVYAIGFLLDELLRHANPLHQPRQLDRILNRRDEAPVGWCEKPQFLPSSKPDEAARQLVQEFMRHGERGGADVKLDLGLPYRAKAWPRAGLRSRLFHWRIGFPWKHQSHINVLELQACVHALQWRLRKASRFKHRVLHLVDSQVVASVLAKGRSSSFRLRKALQKLSALVVAGELRLSVGYIASADNPSDIPSRWAKQRIDKKKSTVLRENSKGGAKP
eukprot:s127_g28.t1